jgi:hypothetical protein
VTPAGSAPGVTVSWDASQVTVPAGTVLDIAPGSALEWTYGLGNPTSLAGTAALISDQTGSGGLVIN